MGIIKIKTVLFLFLLSAFANSQVIKIEKRDSILLKKGNTNNEYHITLFNRDNIKYNKINGYKYDTIPYIDTIIKCEQCKKESYSFLVKKIKKKNKIGNFRTVNDFFKDSNGFNFGGGYFLINGNCYKNLGSPIE